MNQLVSGQIYRATPEDEADIHMDMDQCYVHACVYPSSNHPDDHVRLQVSLESI